MTTNSITNVNTTSSGRVFITGQRTNNLDTGALVEAAYQQKLQPAVTIDARIERNTSKSAAYAELQTLTTALATAVSGLSSTGVDETNQFDVKSGSLASNSSTPASALVSVAIDESAAVGNYQLEILQTAKANVVSSASQASNTDPLALAGDFSLGVQGGGSVNIAVAAGDSLTDIAAKINAETGTTGVRANVLLAAPGEYQLSLVAVNEAVDIQASFVSGDDVLQSIGLTDAGGAFVNVAQAAQQAQLRLDGVLISRNSNDFSDLIQGVDLNLIGAEPGTTLSLNIQEDAGVVQDSILAFVSAYNALRAFIDNQQAVSEVEGEGAVDSAVLFGDNTLRGLNRDLASLINTVLNPAGSLTKLSDIGIELNAIGDLTVDQTKLDNALLNDYAGVRALFETSVNVTGAGDQARLITNNYSGPTTSFTIDITHDGTSITGASVGGDSSLFTVTGNRIVGAQGGPYAGLTFAYLGNADVSLDIDVTSGFANRMEGLSDRYANTATGAIQKNIERLDETNQSLSEDAARIRERAAVYQEREIERYSKLEAAVSESQNLLRYIKALLGNYNNN